MTRPALAALLCCAFFLQGCGTFGYYKYRPAERLSPEAGEKIQAPREFEATTALDGPGLAALMVALNEFFPPGKKGTGNYEPLVRCFDRRDTWDVSVRKANDDLYFISFSANLERCGFPPDTIVLDAGSTYVIDGQGRVLDVR